MWGFHLEGVSDCEELVGLLTGDDGVGFIDLLIFHVYKLWNM